MEHDFKTPQNISLDRIYDLPGITIPRLPDKSYGGLVSSIQSGGVKEPVILRRREDGAYQMVSGYRRRRACELAKLREIPALVYDMTLQEAVSYYQQSRNKNDLPIPGKLVEAPLPVKAGAAPKEIEKPAAPTKPAEPPKAAAKPEPKATTPVKEEKPKEVEKSPVATSSGPAAKGPSGTAITQIFEPRLSLPDEAALKALPVPKEGESLFITLHPAYLKKSPLNNFSVDIQSENYKELLKSVELVGIKDPVLTRINPEGGLEILSGQRRHLAARSLNYPVPAIIQHIDDADAKIIVADGNLHRDKITTYDLSRALRMKMEGMKQKAGRRKKGFTADELNSDEKLAKEMGMSVSKLNRILRLSEASKEVCDRVDDNSLPLSAASSVSFLSPEHQDMVLHLMDLGYKAPTERIEYMKRVEKAGKLDEASMRRILDGINVLEPPQKAVPPAPAPASTPTTSAPAADPTPSTPTTPTPDPSVSAVIPAPSPMVPKSSAPSVPPVLETKTAEEKTDPFKGEQLPPENTKIVLTGDRLRKYFPDVDMTPREIEESIYEALEERRQRQMKQQSPSPKKIGPTR